MKQTAYPGVSHYRDRHQKLRWRYRKDGVTFNLGTAFGSDEFNRRYAAAVNGNRIGKQVIGKVHSGSQPGSLSAVIEGWYQSVEFKSLGPVTQRGYRYIATRLNEQHGKKPVARLGREHIKQFMADKINTPSSANNDLRVWRFLLDYAVDNGITPTNVARTIKKLSTGGTGFHTWTEDEISVFYGTHLMGSMAHRAMTLMLYTAAARSDAVQFGPDHIKDGRLRYIRQKMKTRQGVVIDMPVHPYLQETLEYAEGMHTFLETAVGKPRSVNGIGNAMRAWCDEAALPQCSSHGLRKACARRLIEAGCTPHEMMAITGHKTLAEAQKYADTFNRSSAADRAMAKNSG
jgi:integrase